MADRELRDLERRAAQGDPDAFDQLIQHIVRVTGIDGAQAAARYHFPNLYGWCLAAIQHDTVYYVQEWFSTTDHQPTTSYLKYFTIKNDHNGDPQLSQCWLIPDNKSPHYEELTRSLGWITINRHPWGQHFCFRGPGSDGTLEKIFRVFGLRSQRGGGHPYLRSLFSVIPNSYLGQFEENNLFGYDYSNNDDDCDCSGCDICGEHCLPECASGDGEECQT